jgi:hypothetical protein
VRALIVGGGCRGRTLARELIGHGHAVRIVTRSPERHAAIEAVGAEPWPGDPDRIGSLRYALDNVTVVLWLLGTATGPPGDVAALHGSRLEMMLERSVDTTVRGVVYEAAGTLPAEVYASGGRQMIRANERNEVPFRLLAVDPADAESWQAAAREAVFSLLEPRSME